MDVIEVPISTTDREKACTDLTQFFDSHNNDL